MKGKFQINESEIEKHILNLKKMKAKVKVEGIVWIKESEEYILNQRKVHSDLELLYLEESYLWVKYI